MSKFQQTILQSNSISGYGLHTANEVKLTFKPGPINSGIKFVRVDLVEKPIIKACLDNISVTNRRTELKKNDVIIQTTEHLLAAIICANIDNIIVEIDSPELPILDGSSKIYSDLLKKCG
ncbi:MAG: UDP-3-O-[3-hydroxymyristoyl] N-acetylglucosamine deacetylase, partial [Flavobacteriales bacterium]|nr:UDP-3-O-[3-hydroxymyristoyl] N-acetylglucosamine deacetylase [Flavobacteriales bacterium]